jgi:hypothetical protein
VTLLAHGCVNLCCHSQQPSYDIDDANFDSGDYRDAGVGVIHMMTLFVVL